MTERDLENLKDLPVPPPRETARQAALRAALEVFDETNSALAAGSPLGESQAPNEIALPAGSAKSESEAPQGNIIPFGQTETSQPNRRFFRMSFSSRQTQAIAASIVALVIVAPVAFQELNKSSFNQTFRELRSDPRAGDANKPTSPAAPQSGAEVSIANLPEPSPIPAPAAAPPAPSVATTTPATEPSAATSEPPRDTVARQEKNKVAAVAATEPAPAAKSPDAGDVRSGEKVGLPERFSNTAVEERAAEMEATTGRKGNRKTAIAVVPDPNIPAEISQGLGGAPKDGAIAFDQSASGRVDGAHSVRTPAAADRKKLDELTKGEAAMRGQTSAGKQSLAADNAALGTDYSRTHVPKTGLAFDGGTVRPEPLPAPSPQASVAAVGDAAGPVSVTPPAKPSLNAAAERRMLEKDKYATQADLRPTVPHDPYAWMGHSDEQKAVSLEENRDRFDAPPINPVKQVATEPVSTFSIDVDTASYSFVRRALNAGHLPPKDAVRVEEMINYFPYAYSAPESADVPFKPTLTVTNAPWNPSNKLVHVAIKGYDLKSAERPRANLVFLIDVSGSMEPQDRLPLVKTAFRMLVDELKPDDTIAIVTYASGSGVALEPTRAADKWKILSAIDQLGAGGSTAGAAGIADAYRLAESNFDKRAVNRVILATDGDFNVGITDQSELKSYIERKRQTGIFLSILGVGQGNHNDALMQTLAQNGNGTAAYADTLSEARKVLVENRPRRSSPSPRT